MSGQKFIFGTKAETLERLSSQLTSATVLEQIRCTVTDWDNGAMSFWAELLERKWLNMPLVVRSSANTEDCLEYSNAGKYISVINIQGKNAIQEAVERVIASYGSQKRNDDQVLVQPMLISSSMAGVVFTADLDTLAPYYIVNYDSNGFTESVTMN